MNDLIDTTEMYLRTIFELEEEGIVPLRARIAERLNQSGPTVSQTVARMQRDGLLVVSDDRHLELTDLGRERAIAVMRKHRLAERLLLDVIGLDWQDVHVEACRWEHVMSEQVEQRLVALLGHPQTSPYGNPIPGLDHLGEIRAAGHRDPPRPDRRRRGGRSRRPVRGPPDHRDRAEPAAGDGSAAPRRRDPGRGPGVRRPAVMRWSSSTAPPPPNSRRTSRTASTSAPPPEHG